jgi:hypothetical protein
MGKRIEKIKGMQNAVHTCQQSGENQQGLPKRNPLLLQATIM